MHYDYIVVGAGSAGAAVAYRLSADPRHKVLLLEAGVADNPWTRLPVGSARLITNPAANWLYSGEPEPNTKGRRVPVPRGKLLGGSSAINGMAFVRGQAQDFDTWAQMGNTGWSYEGVLPFFKRMESYRGGGDDRFRGRDGPLTVTDPEPSDPIFTALIKAAGEVGIPHNPDYNGARQDGIAMSQATIVRGRRVSTARAYLDPARKRPNLRIETGALTQCLLLDGRRCIGVRYSIGDQVQEARSAREVVVSAGTINSPQLLELSGIGQPERLGALGIEVRHALPGVGENLRDHYAPRTRWTIGRRGITWNDRGRGPGLVWQALRWGLTRRGMLASVGAPMRAFVRSREGLAAPDLLLGWVPMFTEPGPRGPRIARQSGVTCYAHPMRPESKGHIHVVAADPRQPPAINFNFLSAPVDAELTVRAIQIARAVMTAPAMAPLQVAELAPGAGRTTDEEILDWVKGAAETTYHPVGTCKMGADAMAVVDARLCVRGIGGLRVADASIMPTLTSGNTNAPSIMIGEKAAAMVLEDLGVKAATALKLTWLAIFMAGGVWLLREPTPKSTSAYDLRDSIVGYHPDWADEREECQTADAQYQKREAAALDVLRAFDDLQTSMVAREALRFFTVRSLRQRVCPSRRIYGEVHAAAIRAQAFDPPRRLGDVELAFVSKLNRDLGVHDPMLMEAVARTAFHEREVPSDIFHSDLRPVARAILAEYGVAAAAWSDRAFSLMGADEPLQTTAAQLAVATGHPQALPRTRELMMTLLATVPANQPVPRRTRNRLYELAYALSLAEGNAERYAGPVADLLARRVESWAPPFGMIPMPPTYMCAVGEHLGGVAAEAARGQDFCRQKPKAREQ